MTIVDNRTSNLNLPLPAAVNKLSDDVARLIAALNGIDSSLASTIASLSGKANTSHGHSISDVSGLQSALDQKIGTGTNLPISQVTDLQAALDAKAPVNNANLTGAPTAAAASAGDNSTRIATTGWVRLQGYLTAVPDGAVVSAKIGDLAVTSAKLANSAVTAGKIANDGVSATAQIADGIVTPSKMNNGAAVSILGRSANSTGVRADIAAGANGGILSRLSNALGFNTLTAIFDAVFGANEGRVLRRGASAWEAAELSTGGMDLIGTLTTTSGTTHTLSSIAADYKEWLCVIEGVNLTSTAPLQVALSLDGSTFSAAKTISDSLAGLGGAGFRGALRIHRANIVTTARAFVANIAADPASDIGSTRAGLIATVSGAPNAIRFSGGTFNAGAIYIYGVK
ncbi:MAG: hypothetical protein Q8M31_21635 [Beijerinckiaceae bacterium]|nr:hypothetical protein [Beijerinckiaceae bacterium]